jgi:deazaflavin-dependent oxidoreductase (nitroreductase family)
MALVDQAVKFALSPAGAAIDRFCVRWIGHSPVNWVFSRGSGDPYNVPLLLTARGRKTGRPRSVVLPYFPAGEAIAVVGSRGGMPTDPHWVLNLRADGDCGIRLRRRAQRVRARIATGDERATLWKSITERAPIYLEYEERARGHREIPVIILDGARVES